jgi:hypothetical protein
MNIEINTINILVDLLETNKNNFSELDYNKACEALHEMTNRSTNNYVIFLQSTENSMISEVRRLVEKLRTPVPTFTVTNKDRQKLLEVLWPDTIRRGSRGGFVKMTGLEIKTCISMLVSKGVLKHINEVEGIVLSQKYNEYKVRWNSTLTELVTAQQNLETFRRRWVKQVRDVDG